MLQMVDSQTEELEVGPEVGVNDVAVFMLGTWSMVEIPHKQLLAKNIHAKAQSITKS